MNNNTPRDLKRAVNHLRLLAMRMQIQSNSFNNLDQQFSSRQIIRFIVLRALRDLGVDSKEFLKILADAVKNYSDETLDDIKTLINTNKNNLGFDKLFIQSEGFSDNIEVLAGVVTKHLKAFPKEWPQTKDIDMYNELMTNITLH